MTQKEHQLMIGMFALQLHLIKALTEVLKTNNLMEKEDFPAFMAAASHLDGTPDDLINAAEQRYRKLALELGVPVPTKIV